MIKYAWIVVIMLGSICSTWGAASTKGGLVLTGSGKPDVVEKMVPGKVLQRTAEGSREMTYHVYVPSAFVPTNRMPMVIAFSPGGSGSGIMDQLKASGEKAGWLIVGCDKLKNDMEKSLHITEKEGLAMEEEVLNDILLSVPFRTNRLYLAGMSGGASRSYFISARRKESFTGILAYGGWLGGTEEQKKSKYCKGMAVAMINGDSDKNANAWVASDTIALRRYNCRVKTFPFPGGHVMAPAEVTDKVITWLEEDWAKFGAKRK